MKAFDSLDFDIFKLRHKTSRLYELVEHMFEDLGLLGAFAISINDLQKLLTEIRSYYFDVPFHNFLHAIDVTQMVYLFLKRGQVKDLLEDIEVLALMVAALGHDMGHQGFNNNFMVETETDLMKRFGKQSVLERYSVHCLLGVLSHHERLKTQIGESFEHFCGLITTSILATDMLFHYENITHFLQGAGRLGAAARGDAHARLLIMKMTIKISDISNSLRISPLARRWAYKVLEEFFVQGDENRRRGLAVPPNMDRQNTDPSVAQMAFIDAVIRPTLKVYSVILKTPAYWSQNLEVNYNYWLHHHDSDAHAAYPPLIPDL